MPAGHAAGPSVAGNYYLAITSWDNEPLAGGLQIFNNTFPGVVTPTGPGAGSPVDGWSAGGLSSGSYTIALTGAEGARNPIPEPTTLAILALVGGGLAARRKMRK